MPLTFSIRKKLFSRYCYVFATLPDGQQKKIRRFASEREAAGWVQNRAAEWIAQHRKELRLDGEPGGAPAEGLSAS